MTYKQHIIDILLSAKKEMSCSEIVDQLMTRLNFPEQSRFNWRQSLNASISSQLKKFIDSKALVYGETRGKRGAAKYKLNPKIVNSI